MTKRGPKKPSKYTKEVINKYSDELLDWIEKPDNFWLGKFASDVVGANRRQLLRFAEKNEKFRLALKKAKQIQENKLVLGGLLRKFHPTIVIFALKNVAEWRDKTEIDYGISDLAQLLKSIQDAKRPWVNPENKSPLRQYIPLITKESIER